MRCPACKQYVPDGLGLKICPSCNVDLSSAPVIKAAPTPKTVLPPVPKQVQAPKSAFVVFFRICFIVLWSVLGLFVVYVFAASIWETKIRPQTGIIQSIGANKEYSETYYGDYADAWNTNVEIDFGSENWKEASRNKQDYREIRQYFKEGESVSNWTEALTIDRVVGPIVRNMTTDKVVKGFTANHKKGVDMKIDAVQGNDVYVSGTSDGGTRRDFVHVKITPNVILTATYSTHNVNDEQRIGVWKDRLQDMKVVKK